MLYLESSRSLKGSKEKNYFFCIEPKKNHLAKNFLLSVFFIGHSGKTLSSSSATLGKKKATLIA